MSIELWHVASPEKALMIIDTGFIPLSHREQKPQDRVFSYDEETARRVSGYGDPNDVWVTFVVQKVEVWVGDLRLEGSSEYEVSLVPYLKYERGYEEAEMMVSQPVRAKGFYDRRTFKPLTKEEIKARMK